MADLEHAREHALQDYMEDLHAEQFRKNPPTCAGCGAEIGLAEVNDNGGLCADCVFPAVAPMGGVREEAAARKRIKDAIPD
jgi:hypothetical protein